MEFEWRFDEIAGRTRLTQRIWLKDENAAACVIQVAAAFESSLAPVAEVFESGMRRRNPPAPPLGVASVDRIAPMGASGGL